MEALCEDLFPTPAGAPEPDIIINITAIGNVIFFMTIKIDQHHQQQKTTYKFQLYGNFPHSSSGEGRSVKKMWDYLVILSTSPPLSI